MSTRTPTRRGRKPSTLNRGPLWDKWGAVITGRELRRVGEDGKEEVGVVLHKLQMVATLPPQARSQHDRFTAAWRGADGEWSYPEKWMSSETDTLSWEDLDEMLQDRFIDHPKLPSNIRFLALPLQENHWHPLPEARQKEAEALAEEARAQCEEATKASKRKRAEAEPRKKGEKRPAAASSGIYLRGKGPYAPGGNDGEDESEEEQEGAAEEAEAAAGGGGLASGSARPAKKLKKDKAAAAAPAGPNEAAGGKGKGKAKETPKAKEMAKAKETTKAKETPKAIETPKAKETSKAKETPKAKGAPKHAPKLTPRGADGTLKASEAGPSSAGRATRAAASSAAAAGSGGKGKKAAGKGEEKGRAPAAGGKGKGGAGSAPQGAYVGITGREYPRELCYAPGDLLVADYANRDGEEDPDAEYEVERILDEARVGDHRLYLLKWKGYELDVGDAAGNKGGWEPVQQLRPSLIEQWEAREKHPGFKRVKQAAADSAVAKAKWVRRLPSVEELEALSDSADSE